MAWSSALIRGRLTDEEWSFFEPFVVSASPLGGRPPRDRRRVLDASFWIARTGTPWRALPAELGNWNSVFRQFRRWTASGLWDVMLEALADGGGDADLLQRSDSTSIRAHRCAAGGRGGTHRQGLGRSRGGLTSKPHIRANAHGLPIALHVTAGQETDCSHYEALMQARDSDPAIMLGDNGCDSDPIWQDLRDRGAAPEIPTKRNRHLQHSVSRPLYALRSRIERFINRLKNSRRVATRCDQTADSFLGFAALSSIRLWIRFVHAA
ncbi:IS5 family transposase [Caldovatus sediminis]|uniref:IS5 family transposase n=1 Tax=Caldovatus sediminis TaxID=2041189 RepID=UPI001665A9D5|nr:IS5 family transposase [Caldovatus sediminis]